MIGTSSFIILFPLLALGILWGTRSLPSFQYYIPWLSLLPLWLWLEYRGKRAAYYLFWLIMLASVVMLGQLSAVRHIDWAGAEPLQLCGSVWSVQELNFDLRLLVKTKKPGLNLAVHLPLGTEVMAGDSLSFRGTITNPPTAPNPGVFSYAAYLQQLGVVGLVYPEQFQVRPRASRGFLARLQAYFRKNLEGDLRDPGLVTALLLGDRGQLSKEREENWRLLGISHLLAVSGMHVGLVALLVGIVVQGLPLSPRIRLLFVHLFLLLYVLLVGGGASAWRAFASFALASLAAWRRVNLHPLHTWSLVGFTLLLLQPQLLLQKGFTLSFAASGGILLWLPTLKSKAKNKFVNYLQSSLAASLVAQLSISPLILHYFGEIALLGPLSTLLFLPFVALILIAGLPVALGLGAWGFAQFLNFFLPLLEEIEGLLAPYALNWRPRSWGGGEIILWWSFFIYMGWQLSKPHITKRKNTYRRLVALFMLLTCLSSLPPFFRRPLEVTGLNVGQGDSFYIQTPGGRHLLLDGGGDSPYWQERGRDVGKQRLLPYLRHRGVEKLDAVILSHPHEDHLFGLLAVLEEIEVGLVLDNGQIHSTPTYERYLDLISQKDIPHITVQAGATLFLEPGLRLNVLHPSELLEGTSADCNNNSLVLQLRYGGVKMLFTGDAELPVLYDLVYEQGQSLKADWLKVPHHGSRSGFLPSFYEAVQPKWAVIPVGPNTFGHPHQDVTNYLEVQEITWSTTAQGPVRFFVWWGLLGRFLKAGL